MTPTLFRLLPAVATAAFALSTPARATVIFTDDFSAYGTGTNNLNLNLPATDGSPHPTEFIRQSGSAGSYGYTEAGSDADTQLGNANTDAGQAGGATYADYLLLAYYGQVTCDLPIDEALVQGQPLTISFDLGVNFPPNATDDTNWVAFRMGDVGATWPVVGSAGDFAFLYRINKGIQIFTTDTTPVEFPAMTSGHFTLVFTDGDGTGSAFAGNGSQVALYNGTALIGNFFTGQLTTEYMNFRADGAFGSLDNLKVETGLPDFSTPAAPLAVTHSAFDFTQGKLALSWTSVAGKAYTITHSTSLAAGSWTAVGSSVTATAAETSTTINFTKGAADFFRVELAP